MPSRTSVVSRPLAACSSSNAWVSSRMRGRIRSTCFGDSARPISERSRVCSGGSSAVMISCHQSYSGPDVMPWLASIRCSAWCSRASRSNGSTCS